MAARSLFYLVRSTPHPVAYPVGDVLEEMRCSSAVIETVSPHLGTVYRLQVSGLAKRLLLSFSPGRQVRHGAPCSYLKKRLICGNLSAVPFCCERSVVSEVWRSGQSGSSLARDPHESSHRTSQDRIGQSLNLAKLHCTVCYRHDNTPFFFR